MALEACEHDSSALTGREVGWIRRALANTITRHGAPGSPARTGLRAIQQQVASRPAYTDLARVVAARLGAVPRRRRDPVPGRRSPPTSPPGNRRRYRKANPIPAHLVAKASRALEAPVEELVGAADHRLGRGARRGRAADHRPGPGGGPG